MLSILLLTTFFSLSDPLDDINKNDLQAPNSRVFRNLDAFDLLELDLPAEPTFNFKLKLKRLSNPWSLEFGFSLPIIEVYVKLPDKPIHTELLPGSDMDLPKGEGWSYAFKLTGDGLIAYAPHQGEVVNVTNEIQAVLTTENNILIVTTNLPSSNNITIYTLVGSYDPFSSHGWREVGEEPSPWAFSSKTQKFPVLDILASSDALQKQALQVGILPRLQIENSTNPWTYLIIAGLFLVVLGIVARFWFSKANFKGVLSNPVVAKISSKTKKLSKIKPQKPRIKETIIYSTKETPREVLSAFNFEYHPPKWLEEFDNTTSSQFEVEEKENKNSIWNSKEDNYTNMDSFKNFKKDIKHKEVIKSDSKRK